MFSTLTRQKELGELFSNTDGIEEVYASLEHTQFTEEPTYFILIKYDIEFRLFLYRLQEMYRKPVHIYCTENPFDLMLKGKRIIWRDGKWYI